MSGAATRIFSVVSRRTILFPAEDGIVSNSRHLKSGVGRASSRPKKALMSYSRSSVLSPNDFSFSSHKRLDVIAFQRRNSTSSSWSELIQSVTQTNTRSTANKDDTNLLKVKEQLKQALASRRSHEQGNLLPNVIASEICKLYMSLESQSDKFAFFHLLSSSLDADHDAVSDAISLFNQNKQREDATYLKARERLSSSLDPPYKYLLKDVGHMEEGVKTLVSMRKDLLEIFGNKSMHGITPQMHAFERHLKQHLAQWFSAGFLDLQRITWSSPASLLEKIMKYEQVHPTRGWDDFKRRLDDDRRCFIFTHRLLPGEPLVILHTALGDHLRANMEGIHIPFKNGLTNITAATFYTISSTQKGLSGIDLGNYLIKVVVQELKKEFPTLNELGTLSPIPGFAKWLLNKLKTDQDHVSELWSRSLIDGSNDLNQESFLQWLQQFKEQKDMDSSCNNSEKFRQFLLTLCARYLYCEKRRGFALDPVANFHLRNGAVLWRLNWMADNSTRGMDRSYAIMTNYKYDLSLIEPNNKQYVIDGKIAVSDTVFNLIK